MKRLVFFLLVALLMQLITKAQTSLQGSVLDTVTTRAQFPGGAMAWRKYLEQNLDATVAANDKAPNGNYTVRVEFMVDKEGNVSNATPISVPPLCSSCGPEAVRVIKEGPRWMPAKQRGEAIEYKATQQITFQVRKDSISYGIKPVGPPLIKFNDISLQEAIQQAGETGKIVFAQYEVQGCERCNETANMAFASKELAAVVSEKCVPIKIAVNSADRKEFNKKYNPGGRLGTFFISPDGELVSYYSRTSSLAVHYIAEVNKAFVKLTEGRVTLKELDEEWKASPKNFIAMELNLERRKSFGWFTDNLLDEYVKRLPADSLQSPRVLTFIASMAPSIFSFSSYRLRRDTALFNKAWYALPLEKRKEINQQLIPKSLSRAIASKSIGMAEFVARFTKTIYGDEHATGSQQEYDKQMMFYYRGIRDTTTFLTKAAAYYDTYFMSANVEEIKRIDSINRRKAFDTAKVERVEDPRNKGRFITRRAITTIMQGSQTANELTGGALMLYTYANNKAYLEKAVTWATRAKELSQFADLEGLLPKLLYKLGEKDQAIAMQKDTIKRSQQIRGTSTALQATLALMEGGKGLEN